ncbi:hypothetical protein FGRMN_8553 [Fusarium graminum]|nr:hypothetical protein FGRMN_8553 [Fusarium graminum]
MADNYDSGSKESNHKNDLPSRPHNEREKSENDHCLPSSFSFADDKSNNNNTNNQPLPGFSGFIAPTGSRSTVPSASVRVDPASSGSSVRSPNNHGNRQGSTFVGAMGGLGGGRNTPGVGSGERDVPRGQGRTGAGRDNLGVPSTIRPDNPRENAGGRLTFGPWQSGSEKQTVVCTAGNYPAVRDDGAANFGPSSHSVTPSSDEEFESEVKKFIGGRWGRAKIILRFMPNDAVHNAKRRQLECETTYSHGPHTIEQCSKYQSMSMLEKVRTLVDDRANMPPLATLVSWHITLHTWLEEDSSIGQPLPCSFPWSVEFSRRMRRRDKGQVIKDLQAKFDLDNHDHSVLPEDPSLSSLEAIHENEWKPEGPPFPAHTRFQRDGELSH